MAGQSYFLGACGEPLTIKRQEPIISLHLLRLLTENRKKMGVWRGGQDGRKALSGGKEGGCNEKETHTGAYKM